MSTLFDVMNRLLPLPFLQYDFMKMALCAVMLSTPIFGLLGPVVVNRRMAFFSDALGHSALTGIALGSLLGIGDPLLAMVGFGLLFSLLLVWVGRRNSASTDTTISVFSSTAIAIGLVLLSLRGGFQRYSWYLVGDLLSVQASDLLLMLGAMALVLLYMTFFGNKLFLDSLNGDLAQSRRHGWLSGRLWLEASFTCLVALVVMIAIRWIGVLMINSLLILPAASARNLAHSVRGYQCWAIVLALLSGLVGLILSFYAGTATGATIVVVAGVFYFLSLAWRSLIKS